jgi:hypothetical protein
LVFGLAGAALAQIAWYGVFAHQTPPGQPALGDVDLAALKADFNRDSSQTRIILLLSPT